MSLYAKLITIQKQVSGLKKDSTGHRYNYESLDSIIQLLHPKLKEQNLAIMHTVEPLGNNESVCVTTLLNPEGEMIQSKCPIGDVSKILAKGNIMQGMGSAITYARRYNIKNLFNLYSTDDDAAILDHNPLSKNQEKEIYQLLKELEGVKTFDQNAFYGWLETDDVTTLSESKAKQAISFMRTKKVAGSK